ncbi:hypothetical protein L0B53_18985 (plasmid) [Vibrio sp. SS-MA-C1-2]|uniref:hypothetical protein n=1 Tax=Vibrio sp. SS-MA-C1-2 TaxID=2908646 RepID=UPI001F198A99|nr:hypothetical protein [Vibrio sp. SS-MA-C1-2]UJF20222.1 hypothetical protein L0B53_18985 [Vibrio sp. SS-MA-C1-2]
MLSKDDAFSERVFVRVNNNVMKNYRRNQDLVIVNLENQHWVLVKVWGANGIPGLTKNAIAMDYDTMSLLSVYKNADVRLVVRKATYIDHIKHQWSHDDATIRLPFKISMLAIMLSIGTTCISFIL